MELSQKTKGHIKKNCNDYALITGASSGLGYECANGLAQSGVDLILCSRNEDRLNSIAADLEKNYNVKVIVFAKDLSKPAELMELLALTEELVIDTVIHAAGYGTSGNFLDNTIDEERNMLHLNVEATLLLAYEFGARFKTERRGNLVLFSSILAYQGVAHAANYAATKAYVQSFAEGLAIELKPYNVNVLVAAPGPTATGFAERAKMTMGSAMTPEEVAADILKRIGSRGTVIPGFQSKFLTNSLRMLPRYGKTRVLSRIMKKMSNP